MNTKSVLKFGLLGFLAVALVVFARRELEDGAASSATAGQLAIPADGLVAIYFHGNVRCPTCQTIEAYAKQAIDANFVDDLAGGSLSWQVLNYEEADNGRFVTQYEIAAPTVVLVRREGGRDTQWRNLSRVWELVGDQSAFQDYIVAETRSLLTLK